MTVKNRQTKKCFFGRLAGIFIMALLFFTSCSIVPEEEGPLAPPLVKPPKIEYEVYDVKKCDLKKTGSGTAVFVPEIYESVFYSGSGGHLKVINVKLGDKIEKGMLLAEIDPGDNELKVKQQEAEIKKLELRLEQMGEEDVLLDADIKIAKIDLNTAKVELEIDPIIYNENAAQKAVLRLEQLEGRKRARSLERQVLMLDLEEAMNLLEFYSEQLLKTRLVSPYDADVIAVDTKLKIGDYIESGKELFVVADPSNLVLEYSSELLGSYRTGMKAEVNYKDKIYLGEIYTYPADSQYLTDSGENTAKIIRFRLDNPPSGIKLGDTAIFHVELEKRENVIAVPKSALRTIQNKSMVELVKGNLKREIYVEVGMMTDTMAEIQDGLEEGQKIIIR